MSKHLSVFGFLVATLATTFVGPASAALLLYEPFNYTSGERLGGAGTNPLGQVSPNGQRWITRSPAGNGTYVEARDALITSGSLSYPGLATSGGNSVRYGSSTDGTGLYTDAIALPSAVTEGSIYYSAIVRFNGQLIFSGIRHSYASLSVDTANPLTDAGVGASTASGISNFPLPAGAWIRNSGATDFHFGAGKQNGDGMGTSASAPAWQSGTVAFPNQQGNITGTGQDYVTIADDIYFIVLKYTFNPASPGNTDTVSLWINPIASTLGFDAGEALAAAAGGSYYSATNAFVTASIDANQIQSFMLLGLGQASASNTKSIDTSLDELRIGTTWAEVTPAFVVATPPPSLAIALSGSSATLSWTTNASNYFLIGNTNVALARTNWPPVTNAVSVSGSNFNVTVNLLAPTRFFSLIRTNQP